MAKKCSKCGTSLPDDANFCTKCGENFHTPTQIIIQDRVQTNPTNSIGLIGFIFSVLGLVFIVLSFIVMSI